MYQHSMWWPAWVCCTMRLWSQTWTTVLLMLTDADVFSLCSVPGMFLLWVFCTIIPCEIDFEATVSNFTPYICRGCSKAFWPHELPAKGREHASYPLTLEYMWAVSFPPFESLTSELLQRGVLGRGSQPCIDMAAPRGLCVWPPQAHHVQCGLHWGHKLCQQETTLPAVHWSHNLSLQYSSFLNISFWCDH